MYAVDKILENANVIQLLDHYGFDTDTQNGDLIRSRCMIHGGDNPTSFVINTETSLWFCHTGDCGGGDIFSLVEKMEGLDFVDAVRWLSDFFQIDIEGMDIKEKKSRLKEELKAFMKAVRGRKKQKVKKYSIDAEVSQVKSFRKFSEDTIKHFQMGFTKEVKLEKRSGGNYTLYNRLVFPILFEDQVVGMALRRTKSSDVPKWSNQPVNIDTSTMLYNYSSKIYREELIIVEGITDVWAYHELGLDAVCTFGAHLTEEQYKLLIRSGADIILSYDADDAGRNATKKAIKMLKGKANVYVIDLPEGSDPDSIDREELLSYYKSRKRVA